MGKKLLLSFGYNTEKQIISVTESEKGCCYTCPLCGERIIARKGGKLQRPHFAHFKKSNRFCSGESVLLHWFKQKAFEQFHQHIETKTPFLIHWNCPYCSKQHSKDLLKKVEIIQEDYPLNGQHIDIVLMEKDKNPLIAINFVFKRKLTKKSLDFFEKNGIILIQYHLSEKDWTHYEQTLAHPSYVTFCENTECYNYQFYQNCIHREIFRQKFKCKKCGKVIDGYMVRKSSAFGKLGLGYLSNEEKQEIVKTYFRGKRAIQADIVVYGKCRCIPHSKGLVCLNQTDDLKETHQGKIHSKK